MEAIVALLYSVLKGNIISLKILISVVLYLLNSAKLKKSGLLSSFSDHIITNIVQFQFNHFYRGETEAHQYYDFSFRRELKPAEDITPEERDARTAFCMQLARNIRPRDLEEFFSKVGQVSSERKGCLYSSTCICCIAFHFVLFWGQQCYR